MSIQEQLLSLRYLPSGLRLPDSGILPLQLIQASVGAEVIGDRLALEAAQNPEPPSGAQLAACRHMLSGTQAGTLSVTGFHPGLVGLAEELGKISEDRTFVGLEGIGADKKNKMVVASSGAVFRQDKISLSSEDISHQVEGGSEISLFGCGEFEADGWIRWGILNCHDYSHVDILRAIQPHQLEVLVVVTYNVATRLYWQYATSDVHRLYCFVIVVNIAELGGSGVFAPFRRLGRGKNAQVGAGGQIFGSRGSGEFAVVVPLEIGELRKIRGEFRTSGIGAKILQDARSASITPMVPPEQFIDTFDRPAGNPPLEEVVTLPIDWNFTDPLVAVAQLDHIGFEAYLQNQYRIRNDARCAEFEDSLNSRLDQLESECRRRAKAEGPILDLLVFPEVFIPRTFLPALQAFSHRTGAIVIAGIDYPDGGEEENANQCAILLPDGEVHTYTKITRSQYDALAEDRHQLMSLNRGSKLLRLVGEGGRGIGILICYDFSHLDLMWSLNLEGREQPLDLTIVVAHNPFGELYKSCCIADSHRFYQYVIMCNVAEFGGSGIFAPIRTPGARQVVLEGGKAMQAIAMSKLDLAGLNAARQSDDQDLHQGEFIRRPGVFQRRFR